MKKNNLTRTSPPNEIPKTLKSKKSHIKLFSSLKFAFLTLTLFSIYSATLHALPPTWPSASYGVCDGTGTAGVDLLYQYTSTETGKGFIKSNWATCEGATSYKIKITSGPSITLLDWTNIGNVTSTTTYLAGISLNGAWIGTTYYVHIIPVNSDGDGPVGISNGVQIAEKENWDGVSVTGLRNEITGGYYTTMWSGGPSLNTFYGNHYFETVNILANTTCYVQGFGRVESVPAGISSSDPKVTNPKDGWLGIHANNITVSGYITASGRGYGGGGGGGGPWYSNYVQGYGGNNGLGGKGGATSDGANGGGCGGGGSPGGQGGSQSNSGSGGGGNIFGGGGGGAGHSGKTLTTGGNGGNPGSGGNSPGSAGGINDISIIGSKSNNAGGSGGGGEFTIGGGGGGGSSGIDGQGGGGGGGGYGGGGGAGSDGNAGGGGGGGSGGSGANISSGGAAGCGPYGGLEVTSQNTNGNNGGYLALNANGDSSVNKECYLGSGGSGGSGSGETGGGGGGAGGGFIKLVASTITIGSSARLLSNGAAGGGGGSNDNGSILAGSGGNGAGGAVLLDARWVTNNATGANFSVRGGNGSTTNGGTIKIFAQNTFSGSDPTSGYYGRLYKNVLPSTTTVRDGSSTDIDYSSVTAYLQANWDNAVIRTAGRSLNRYEFKIGHIPYGNEVLDWTSAGTNTSTTSYISLEFFKRYFITVRTVDDTGFWGEEATSDGVYIQDFSSPTVTISSFSAISPTQIKVYFSANDGESGLATNPYFVEISQNPDMSGSTNSGWISNTDYTFPSLQRNQRYYFRVKAKDKADNIGTSSIIDWRTKPGNYQEKSIKRSGQNGFGFVGDGAYEYDIPVKANQPLTVTAYIRYNTAYDGTNYTKPKLILSGRGISTTSVSATAAAEDAWELLTINAGTPSVQSTLKLKMEGYSPLPNARFFVDDITVNQ